ncbi:MAG: LysR family transcriptional regulator [Azospirillaceae bacterium]
MDWRGVTFDWNRARAFLVTCEEGSLSAAARALGLAQPTLGRQVAALEAELGVVLVERVGRGVAPTPAGLDLLEHLRAMAEAAGRVSLAASGRAQSIEGTIRITASEIYAAHVLPPILAALRREEPGIAVEIVATNSLSDLRRREADIAVRNGRPTDPDLLARRLADDSATFYATPDYLDRAGPFPDIATLARADFVGFDDNAAFVEGLNAAGLPVTADRFAVRATSHLVHWAMVRQGAGIGVVPTGLGDADPAVRRAAPWFAPLVFPVWLVAHRELNTSRRVRLVFDRLAAALG